MLRRIRDLILYTRYVELHHAYDTAVDDAKAQATNEMLEHAHRIYTTGMVHSYGLWSRLAGQSEAEKKGRPAACEQLITDDQVQAMLTRGIEANRPVEIDIQPVEFTADLVPAGPLQLPDVEPGAYPSHSQDHHTYFVWVDQAPATIHMKVTTQHVWDLRPHKITLARPVGDDFEQVDESGIVKPDAKTYDVVLKTPHDGLHRIVVIDGGDYTRIVWPDDLPVTLPSTMGTGGAREHFRGAWTLYFYVPKGTKQVGGWAERIAQWAPQVSGRLLDADGRLQFDFHQFGNGWFTAPVPQGQDGRLWKFADTQGMRKLVTVPSYFAPTGRRLLLPREVVAADAAVPE